MNSNIRLIISRLEGGGRDSRLKGSCRGDDGNVKLSGGGGRYSWCSGSWTS